MGDPTNDKNELIRIVLRGLKRLKFSILASAWLTSVFVVATNAADWPQWRFDANRSAVSPEKLPTDLRLEWTLAFPQRVQVWDDPLNHDLMTFDKVFEPIVVGNLMFIGFNDRDKVVAFDINTGREVWTYFTEGPVRLPPSAWDGKLYIASDDGFLHCVTTKDGSLVWKHRGGPSARKVLGNGRLVSAWPARGGPVVRDGKVYFAASIWPFMGTFIYALDANTGGVMWVNDGNGSQFIKQPHAAPAFAGVAPQGALVATREMLLVPGGRSVPAAFDLRTGDFRYYQLDDGGKGNGGSFVASDETNFFVHTRFRGTRSFELKTGKKGTFTINEPVLAGDLGYFSGQPNSSLQAAVVDAEQKLAAAKQGVKDATAEVAKAEEDGSSSAYKKATNSLATAQKKIRPATVALETAQRAASNAWSGYVIQGVGRDKKLKWELKADGTGDIIMAGGRLYAGGTNSLIAIDLASSGTNAQITWSHPVDGLVQRLVAASGKLIAVTLDGKIMVFGNGRNGGVIRPRPQSLQPGTPAQAAKARDIVERASATQGYALWYGLEDWALLQAVLTTSDLQIVAVDPDAARVAGLRRYFDATGFYGSRISVHVGDPLTFSAPQYLASLVVIGDSMARRLADPATVKAIYESVRPYGGMIWTGSPQATDLQTRVQAANLVNARVTRIPAGLAIVREGPLPGSAEWTHQYGDAANTVKSDDRLVKLPLGVLWFGGSSHMDVLPRHGHGPSEQIAGGRLFIQGMNSISSRDVYTGRVLWKTDFADLGSYGVYFDSSYTNTPLSTAYNQKHIPGANARGANYVVTANEVYVIVSNTCHVLNATDGRLRKVLELPKRPEESVAPDWGFIGLHGDVLLAGTGFAYYNSRLGLSTNQSRRDIVDLSASRGLAALDRHTGRLLWRTEARHGFVHNGIVVGNGTVYCLDKLPKSTEDKLKRRGRNAPKDYRIAAFDLKTGATLWEANTNIFGTWLSFSRKHDVLLQAGAAATDRLKDEASQGMTTYHGRTGKVLWQKPDVKYTGPCVIHNDLIITTPTSFKTSVGGYGLLDGQSRSIGNPLTGVPEPLRIYRTYGCNHAVACENILTFRSGAAGYYDLESHSGTGNFGGFKSGCSANLIAADGVLNAPDYTRTCSCAYQNQTSLAMVHMPELELWTHNQYGIDAKSGQRVKRVGINFGAPGDRMSQDGTLWLDYPSVGGTSPNIWVTVTSSETNYFRRHASQFSGQGHPWVLASGVVNAERITIRPETRRGSPPPPAKKKAEDDDDDDDDDDEKDAAKTNATSRATAKAAVTNSTVELPGASLLPPAEYTVRLYFAEPDLVTAGERVFEVRLQGKTVLPAMDIVAAAGGTRVGIVKEFKNVVVSGDLSIDLVRAPGTRRAPVLSGAELILEEELQTVQAGQR